MMAMLVILKSEDSESKSDNDVRYELASSASFSDTGDTDTESSHCVSICIE